jgi:hypothetical protein
MIGRLTICGISLLALGGCLSRPQPFVQSVAAAPLRPIGLSAPVPDPVLPPRTEAKPSLLADLDADATPADVAVEEPAPERTNIQGADDGSMMVETVVVVARNVPHRAPDYSPEQTASMVCLAQKTGFSVSNARRAHEATVAAKAADQRFGAGLATLKEVDDAERKRQDAVRDFIMPVPLLGFFFDGAQKKADLPPPRQGEMVIEDADLFFFTEHGKEVMAVSGVVRNTGARPAELPPVTLAALDAWEFQLAGQTSLLPFERLAPGEAHEFELRFNNPPETTAEVYIHFAPPFSYRARRDCDFFDPSVFDESAQLTAGVPGQTAAAGPTHAAAELNMLTLYYRRESAEAWRCRDWTSAGCAWGRHALRWRDMFEMSEAVDTAWIALRAATAARNDPAAEAARDAAFAQFNVLGDAALARAGTTAPDIVVSVSASSYGRDHDGLYLELAGTITNRAAQSRTIDALMLAFVDRLDLPLSSMAIDFVRTVQPGEIVPFAERIMVAEALDPDRPWSRRAGRNEDALARVPPRSIPWEVRVGAMAR